GDDIGAQVAVSAEWPWEAPVRLVSEALARGDRASAEWAWRNAWGAALGARRWEGMAAVGGLALQMGESPRARGAYLGARFRGRGGSVSRRAARRPASGRAREASRAAGTRTAPR